MDQCTLNIFRELFKLKGKMNKLNKINVVTIKIQKVTTIFIVESVVIK